MMLFFTLYFPPPHKELFSAGKKVLADVMYAHKFQSAYPLYPQMQLKMLGCFIYYSKNLTTHMNNKY